MIGYWRSIRWMVENDDTEWADNDDPPSVLASFIEDAFSKAPEKVRADTIRTKKALDFATACNRALGDRT